MIKIIDDWYITIDPYPTNYVVRRGKGEKGKNGKWLDRSRGYFNTLQNAVKEVRRQYVAEHLSNGERTLGEALGAVSDIDTRFEKILEKVNA